MLKWTESFMWNIEVKYFFDFEAYFDILDTFHIDCASFSKEIRENKWTERSKILHIYYNEKAHS